MLMDQNHLIQEQHQQLSMELFQHSNLLHRKLEHQLVQQDKLLVHPNHHLSYHHHIDMQLFLLVSTHHP